MNTHNNDDIDTIDKIFDFPAQEDVVKKYSDKIRKHVEYRGSLSLDKHIDTTLIELERETKQEAYKEWRSCIPLRSDWDDDEHVTAQMVIDTMVESINEHLQALNPNQ